MSVNDTHKTCSITESEILKVRVIMRVMLDQAHETRIETSCQKD